MNDIKEPLENYDPTKEPTDRLKDDWRIVIAWWSQIKQGREFTYSKEQVLNLAHMIYKELKGRGIEFHPEEYTEAGIELWKLVTGGKLRDYQDLMELLEGDIELDAKGEFLEQFSVSVNGIGTVDTDSVKGCIGNCYAGDCYALRTAQRYNWDFHKPKIRYFKDSEREKFMRQIQKACKDSGRKFARIGVMGDPSLSWSNTVRVAELIRDAGLTPVVITKWRRIPSDEQLKKLKEAGTILHTSICVLDGAVITKRFAQGVRYKKMGGKSLMRLITYEPGRASDSAIQSKLLQTKSLPILETPLRMNKSNPLVKSGRVANPNKPVKLTKRVCAAEPPNDCYNCKEQCGVSWRYSGDEIVNEIALMEEELADIGSSGEELGDVLFLSDVIKNFKDFYTSKPHIYLVGGVANHPTEGTKGDVDILVRQKKPRGSEELPLVFRLYRMFPRDMWDRIQILWSDEDFGPFTNYVPLYDKKYQRCVHKELVKMSKDEEPRIGWYAEFDELYPVSTEDTLRSTNPEINRMAKETAARGVKPFRFFEMLKGISGYRKMETFTPEGVLAVIKETDYPYEVDEKYDGMRIQMHKLGNRVKIMTLEGEDITAKVPFIADELQRIGANSIVLDAELTGWTKGHRQGEHIGRSDVAGFIHSKEGLPHKNFYANTFDVIYFNGRDLHNTPLAERRVILEQLPSKEHIHIIEMKLAKNKEELLAAIKWAAAFPGSEGAMIKSMKSAYPLNGMTSKWIKFKKETDIDAEVIAVHSVSGSTTKNYLCVLRNGRGDPVPVGRTYNTPIQAKIGDIIRVAFVNMNEYTDPKTQQVWYNWWSPRVIEKREDRDKPDLDTTAANLVKETKGEHGTKPYPKRYREVLETEGDSQDEVADMIHYLLFDANPYLTPADEDKTWNFVVQNHFRGKSIHQDLRMERPSFLVGFTLNVQEAGKPAESVDTVEEAKAFAKNASDIKSMKDEQKVVAEPKGTQPLAWLEFEGSTQRGEVGSTKQYGGIFDIVCKGEVEFGTQKPDFHEFWLHDHMKTYDYSGRLVVRLLKNVWGGRAGRGNWVWMAWFTKDSAPYILTKRAVDLGEMPPDGLSWIPKALRSKIPEGLRYWNFKGDKAKEVRDELVKQLRELKLLDTDAQRGRFALTKICWRGPIHVRGGCSREEYHLFLDRGKGKVDDIILDGDPVDFQKVSALRGEPKDKKYMTFQGQLPNKSELNPDLETPANMEHLENGFYEIISEDGDTLELEFNKNKGAGKNLKGTWKLYRTRPKASLWVFKKV